MINTEEEMTHQVTNRSSVALKEIKLRFNKSLAYVNELLTFDETIQKVCISALNQIKRALKSINPLHSVDNQITMLSDIRNNGSLDKYYGVMHNQCVVLLVSYFTSAIEDVFIVGLADRIANNSFPESGKYKLSINDMLDIQAQATPEAIASLIVRRSDGVNFQNMKSIIRSCNDYLNIDIKKDALHDTIAVAHICRHSIVHSGAIARQDTITQIQNYKSSSIQRNIMLDSNIQFSHTEVTKVSESMKKFINTVIDNI